MLFPEVDGQLELEVCGDLKIVKKHKYKSGDGEKVEPA
jgi:hypothetical protein